MILLRQMSILFMLMLVGVYCRKRGIFNDEANKRISSLVVNVANPALVLSSGINQESAIAGMEFLKVFALAWLLFGVLMLVAVVMPYILKVKKEEYGTYRLMTVFSNIGFMGFPVISAVYGEQALLYASLFLMPYNVLIYTYGIAQMGGERKENEEMKTVSSKATELKKILNVGVIASVLTLCIYLLRIPVPGVVENVVDTVSSLTAPLSMMVIGDSLAQTNLKKCSKTQECWYFLL